MQAIVRQLQSDKRTLSEAISQLNVYYQQKIALIEQQNKHYEEIIEEKDRHVKQARIETEKYEVETRRMIAILDNAHRNFENEKKDLQQSLAQQGVQIQLLRQKNQELSSNRDQQEARIEELAQKYLREIDRLNQELRELKEDANEEDICFEQNEVSVLQEESQQFPLKDISNIKDIGQLKDIGNLTTILQRHEDKHVPIPV